MLFHIIVFEGHGHPYKHNIVQLDPTSNRRGPNQVETRQSKVERAFGLSPEPPVLRRITTKTPETVKNVVKTTKTTKVTKSVKPVKSTKAAEVKKTATVTEATEAPKHTEPLVHAI